MWLARLLVQIAEAALFAYLLLYFRSLDPAVDESQIARLFGAVLAAALPIAIIAGRFADRSARHTLPLALCACGSALGLVAMSLAANVSQAVAAYILFGLATTVFLSLHSGHTLAGAAQPAASRARPRHFQPDQHRSVADHAVADYRNRPAEWVCDAFRHPGRTCGGSGNAAFYPQEARLALLSGRSRANVDNVHNRRGE